MSVRKDVEEPTHTLFTLKTQFNDAWKFFNVAELDSRIKSQWKAGSSATVLGKRSGPGPIGPVKRVRLIAPPPPGGGQSRISFVQDGGSESTVVPVLGRLKQSTAGNFAQQDVRKWTDIWLNTGKFLVSRRKTKQLWDLTRRWNEQLWNTFMDENGLRRPFDPRYEASVLPDIEHE